MRGAWATVDREGFWISRAAELAAEMGHEVVGTEHLLLALVEEQEGGAAGVIREVGVLDRLRDELRRTFGRP